MLLFAVTEGGQRSRHRVENSRSFSGMGNGDFPDAFEESLVVFALKMCFPMDFAHYCELLLTPWFLSPESKPATAAMPKDSVLEGSHLRGMSGRNAVRLALSLHTLQHPAAPGTVILCRPVRCPASLSPSQQPPISLSDA